MFGGRPASMAASCKLHAGYVTIGTTLGPVARIDWTAWHTLEFTKIRFHRQHHRPALTTTAKRNGGHTRGHEAYHPEVLQGGEVDTAPLAEGQQVLPCCGRCCPQEGTFAIDDGLHGREGLQGCWVHSLRPHAADVWVQERESRHQLELR
jgi:hypothetical protein